MVKPYSDDLRWRVVRRVEAGDTCRAVATMFDVSVASVVRWSQRFRTTGSVAPKPIRRAIRAAGAKLLFLPPYSPDLNPIEQVCAKRPRVTLHVGWYRETGGRARANHEHALPLAGV